MKNEETPQDQLRVESMKKKKLTEDHIQKIAISMFGACPIIEFDLKLHSRKELINFGKEINKEFLAENENLLSMLDNCADHAEYWKNKYQNDKIESEKDTMQYSSKLIEKEARIAEQNEALSGWHKSYAKLKREADERITELEKEIQEWCILATQSMYNSFKETLSNYQTAPLPVKDQDYDITKEE